MQNYKISYCKIYVKLHVKFMKKLHSFFAHFLKHCAHQNLLFFFLFINFSRKPPLLLLLLKINPKTQFHEKNELCLGTLYSVESRNLHRKVDYQRYGRYFRPPSLEYSSYNFFRRRQSQKCR